MKGYGQFCPVAKAAEILCERWTLLVLRELLAGSVRFNEIRRGVPLISPTLLAQRLRSLEDQGLLERRGEDAADYRLTEAGMELAPLLQMAGEWGQRWVRSRLADSDLDAGLLMWDMRRCVQAEAMPRQPVCIHFQYPEQRSRDRDWWLLVEDGAVDLCLRDPGREPDLHVITDLRTMSAIWIGSLGLPAAVDSGRLRLHGPADLRRSMRRWLGRSPFAGVPPARPPEQSIS